MARNNLPSTEVASLFGLTKMSDVTANVHAEFGGHLPVGCPPTNAIVGPKLLFRLVEKEDFGENDFKTTREQGKFTDGNPCQRCSISTQSTEVGARKMRRLVPHLADRKIAYGVVPIEGGALLHTPSSRYKDHWSWWPKKDVVRHSYFELINEAA